MSDSDEKRDANVDALAALAGGADPTPSQAEQAQQQAESDQVQDDADALDALAGAGPAPGVGTDAVAPGATDGGVEHVDAAADMAPPSESSAEDSADMDEAAAALAAADAGPVDLAAELAAHDSGNVDPAVVLEGGGGPAFEGAGPALSVEEKRARSRTFSQKTKRAHAYQFKKTMIPLLIVVAAVLLVMGTMAIFVGGDTQAGDGTSLNDTQASTGQNDMSKMRPFLIIASFVVGPVLLLGAWMFYIDVRRSDQRAARRPAASAAGRPDAPK